MLAKTRCGVLIVNPLASGVTEERTRAVERELRAFGEIGTVATERRGHATDLAREASADALFVFSGDGVFNEVVNGVEGSVSLGFIPGGGTSVLPRALGLPRDPVAAARRLALARSRRISLGRVNGRRFAFAAGIGFDAEVVRRVDALGRGRDGRRPGDLAFVWAILRLLAERRGRFEPALELEGLGRAAFALVSNADPFTYAGPFGLHLAPRARFELGLDVVAPVRVFPRNLPRIAGYVLSQGRFGRRGLLAGHDLDRIEVLCDAPLPLQADGEDLGDAAEVLFECERDAVSVLV